MSLAEHQRALARVCMAREADAADLASLGGRADRWLLYRHMVRNRLTESIAFGVPRTRAALGPEGFRDRVIEFFAESPPATRYVREVTLEFVRFAEARWPAAAATGAAPPYALDLARLEAAQLAVSHAEDALPEAGPFALDRPAVVSPAHRLVRAAWDVHNPTPEEGAHAPGAFPLLVHRAGDNGPVETMLLSETAVAIFEGLAAGERPAVECINAVVLRYGGADERFLASLGDLLADLVERRVVLGSRL